MVFKSFCLCVVFPIAEVGIEFRSTIWTKTVRKHCVRMIMNIGFNLVPKTLVIAYVLARSTNGHQTSQCLDLGKGALKLGDKGFSLQLHMFALGDIDK